MKFLTHAATEQLPAVCHLSSDVPNWDGEAYLHMVQASGRE